MQINENHLAKQRKQKNKLLRNSYESIVELSQAKRILTQAKPIKANEANNSQAKPSQINQAKPKPSPALSQAKPRVDLHP